MAKRNETNEALARSINDLGLAEGANANEVIRTWSANASEAGHGTYAQLQQVVPVIQSFTAKIAEMKFENRQSGYSGEFKSALDRMYDKDLVYGHGREYNLPNFLPIVPMNVNQFVPTAVTTPVNTTSVITIDEPFQCSLTLQPDLYLSVVNNGGNVDNFVNSLKTSLTASVDTYIENKIVENYLLEQTKDANVTNLTFAETGLGSLTENNKGSKYNDQSSRNMKECFNTISWLLQKMTSTATEYFNLGGTSSNGMLYSSMDSIKIFCTNKFYQNVVYGLSLGLFKPELLQPIMSKLVPLPDVKVSLPTATNTKATNTAWANRLDDNKLFIVNVDHSFKFGKQFKNTSSQYFAKNMAIEITTNYLPYFGYLKDGQALVYSCNNLNTLPANPMTNTVRL